MSWDIVLFNSRQHITNPEDIDEAQLEPTDFSGALRQHFNHISIKGNHCSIEEESYSIDYFEPGEAASNMLLNLYGEQGLFELVLLAKQHGWQIFDTGLGYMIDLDDPARNGYPNFQEYLRYVKNNQ